MAISRSLSNLIEAREAHNRFESKVLRRFSVATSFYDKKYTMLVGGRFYETYQKDTTEVFMKQNKNDYSVTIKQRNREDKIDYQETKKYKSKEEADKYMDTLHNALNYADKNSIKHYEVLSDPEKYATTTRGIGSTSTSRT